MVSRAGAGLLLEATISTSDGGPFPLGGATPESTRIENEHHLSSKLLTNKFSKPRRVEKECNIIFFF